MVLLQTDTLSAKNALMIYKETPLHWAMIHCSHKRKSKFKKCHYSNKLKSILPTLQPNQEGSIQRNEK